MSSDPDHLVVVSTLVADTRGRARSRGRLARRGRRVWATRRPLLASGPRPCWLAVLLPQLVEQSAEALIGVIIVRARGSPPRTLAVAAPTTSTSTSHDGQRPRARALACPCAEHQHGHPVRTPASGVSRSGSCTAWPKWRRRRPFDRCDPRHVPRLCRARLLVVGCALSMALLSALVGGALNAATARRRLVRAIPALGSVALAFGAWYVVAALQAM